MILRLACVLVVLGSAAPFVAGADELPPPKVTEIRLTRSGNADGTGPEDVLTLRGDGTTGYVGTKNVERLGSFSGTIPGHAFKPAFPLLADMYESLRGRPHSTGKPTGGVTAVTWHVVRAGAAAVASAFAAVVTGAGGDPVFRRLRADFD